MSTIVDEKLARYKALQSDMQLLYVQKQKILSQLNENTLVKGELDLLDEESNVFKLVGPVLMNVDLHDAKENVNKRLEFIDGEISKVEKAIAEKQKDAETLGDEIAEEQQKMQAEAAQAARSITSGIAT
eukprot:gene21729-28122_t